MSDLFSVFIAGAFILFYLYGVAGALRAQRARSQNADPNSPEPALCSEGVPVKSVVDIDANQVTPAELSAAVETFGEFVRDTRWALRSIGRAGVMLEHTLDELVDQPYQALAQGWRWAARRIERGETLEHPFRERAAQISRSLESLEQRVRTLERLARDRSDPALAELLDDADAVAAAFTRPFVSFTRSRSIGFPSNHPITVPAGRAPAEGWQDLLPAHPVIQVPHDFGEELFRWMSLPHELAHVIWDKTPGLAAEVREVLGLRGEGELRNAAASGDVPYALATAWLPELFADWMTVIQTGPAAVHGMHHVFASPSRPLRLARVGREGGYYASHPPPHLRVLYMCGLLHRMGFDLEAREALDAWTELHPRLNQISVPLADAPDLEFGAAELAAFITEYALRLYRAQLKALDGYAFDAIPGFEMRPGVWRQVNKAVPKLLRGASFHDDARILVVAAVLARRKASADSEVVMHALREAIVGLHAPLSDRRVRAISKPRVSVGLAGYTRRELRDALVLSDMVARRGRGARPLH